MFDLRVIDRAAHDLVHENGGAAPLSAILNKSPSSICHEVDPNREHAKFGLLDAVKVMAFRRDLPAVVWRSRSVLVSW